MPHFNYLLGNTFNYEIVPDSKAYWVLVSPPLPKRNYLPRSGMLTMLWRQTHRDRAVKAKMLQGVSLAEHTTDSSLVDQIIGYNHHNVHIKILH